ncbi:MAG: Ig-like domain repeat protein, partial [Spirochaetales bacterium]|nr:Ig-like domain repeat protein [Spirochaetales bacterium]
MKSRHASTRLIGHTALALMLVLSVVSCEGPLFGLGGQVDLSAPTISIEAPTRDSYIADDFIISGTVQDDLAVQNVTVEFSDRNAVLLGSFPATISGEDFSLPISLDEHANIEGYAVITAIVVDSNGKTARVSTSVSIDTKAPVVLVTSPMTKAPDTPIQSEYVDIKGEVFDRSPIASVIVTLCDGSGTVIAGPQTAEGTNTWTTRFMLKGAIADLADGVYHYNVSVSDYAGNTSSYYFHRSDIIAIKDASASFPAMDEIGRLDQDGSAGDSGITAGELETVRIAASSELSDFRYISTPLIEFDFSNLTEGVSADENLLAPNSKITGAIIPPTGSGAIDKTTVSAELYDTNDACLFTIQNTTDDETDNIKVTTVGSAANFAITLKNGVDPLVPAKYSIVIRAETDAGVSGQENAVPFTIDAEAPTFSETSIEPTDLFKSSAFTFSFNGSHTTELRDIVIEQSFEGAAYTTAETIPLSGTSISAQASGSMPTGTNGDGLYNYRITLSTVGGKSTTILRSITFDSTPPNIEITNVNPVVGSDSLNGEVALSVSATDSNGISSVRRWILPATADEPSWDEPGYGEWTATPYSCVVDTTAVGMPVGATTLWIRARDKAGNEYSISDSYTIDQASDKPVLSNTNMNLSFDTEPEAAGNLQESGAKITATITDDDGVDGDSITISIDGAASSAVGTKTAQGTGYNIQHDLSALGEGVHYIVLNYSDVAGLPGDAKTIYFVVDKTVPTVTITGPLSGSYKNGDFTVSGTADDGTAFHTTTPLIATIKKNSDPATAVSLGGTTENWTIDAAGLESGSYLYTVTAMDQFGKTGTATVTVIVDKDAPVVTIGTPAADSWNRGTTLTATGTVSEANGIVLVEYSTNSTDGSDGDWNPASGTSTWSASALIDTLGEGAGKLLHVRATDIAGNIGFLARAFGVDQSDPATSVSGPTSSSAAFELSGTATDTNAVSTILVTQIKNGEEASRVTVLDDATLSGVSDSWTSGSTLPAGGVATGSYEYTITITDTANHQKVYFHTVTIDLDPPSSSIVNPAVDDILFGDSYTVRGTASDTGPSLLNRVEYSLDSTNGVDGSWTSAVGTDTWSANLDLITVGEGTKTLWTRAIDNAGNVQASPDSATFMVDQNSPTLTETTSTYGEALVYVAGDVAFGGASTDANGIDRLVVTYEKNGTTITALDQSSGDTSWAWTLDDALGDGAYLITVTATDKAGRTAPVTRRVQVDTTGPTLTVDQPLAGQAVTSTPFTISGSSLESGGSGFDGTADVEYSLDGWTTTTPLTLTAGAWSASVGLGASQGARSLQVRSTDRLGNSSLSTIGFFYDESVPSISEDLVVTEETQYINGDLPFSVSASDTWMMHPSEPVEVLINGTHAVYLTGSGTYSYIFPVDTDGTGSVDTSGYQNGEYTITFIAKDAALRTNSVTRSVLVDTTIPTLSGITNLGSEWQSSESITIGGMASDGSGSGVYLVEYDINDSGIWKPLASTASFSGVITIPSGTSNKLEIRATDKAGNESVINEQLVNVDTINPGISLLSPSSVPYFSGLSDESVSFTGIDGQSGVDTVELRVDSSDFGTPDASATTPTAGTGANGTWQISIPASSILAAGDGQCDVYVRATDAAGNYSTISFPIIVDTNPPSAAISAPLTGTTVNKLISVSGTASDAKSLASVLVEVQTGASTWATLGTFTGENGYNWTIVGVNTEVYDAYDADSGTAGVQMTLRVTAADASGRTAVSTRTVTVDQSSDRPTIRLSNLSVPSALALSADASTDVFSSASAHGLKLDDAVGFFGSGLAGVIDAATTYYVLANGLSTTQFKVASTRGGSAVDVSSAATNMYLSYGGAYPSTLRMSRTVFGTVSDDDGQVGSLRVSEDNITFSELIIDGGTWSYDASSGDGLKSLYFIVEDAATPPVTFRTDTANEPRIQLAAGYHETYVQFRVDTIAPEFSASSPVQVDYTSPYDFSDAVDLGGGTAFGGPNASFALRVLARDANGVPASGARVLVPGAAGSPFTAVANGTDPVQTTYTRFDTGVISVDSVPDGSVNMSIEVTDVSGLTSATSRSIIVDNTAPALGFIAPSTGSLVKADTTISGNATDGGSGLDDVSYRIGLDYASDDALAPGGESYLWEIPFDLEDTSYQDPSESYLDSSTGTDIYILPFIVKASDQAGNTRETVPITGTADARPSDTTLTDSILVANPLIKTGQVIMVGSAAKLIASYDSASGTVGWVGAVSTAITSFEIYEYALRIFPDGDKPTASINYPLDGSTLGGNIRLYGIAEDNQAVSEVWMQIDTDSDGTFDADDDAIGGWYNGGLGKKVDGASSWSYTINTEGEFDPPVAGTTKKLDIRVQAKDINGKIGPWSAPISMYVDAQVPQISDLVLDPDTDPGNGNEIPYEDGMYLRGSWYLRGSIIDEGAVDEIRITGAIESSIEWNGVDAYTGDTASFTLVEVSSTASPMYKRVDLNIPIVCPPDTSATWNFSISAFDNSDPSKETYRAMRLNIDTQAPTAGLASPTSDSTLVQQSDGWYKIKGTASDDGSDIDRIELFFVRQGATDAFDRIYNPLKSTGNASYLDDITLDTNGSPTITGTADSRSITSLSDALLVNQPMINVGQKILIGTELRTVSAYVPASGTVEWL